MGETKTEYSTNTGDINVTNDVKSSIKLSRGQKGTYGWEIKVYNDDLDLAVTTLKKVDADLKAEWSE